MISFLGDFFILPGEVLNFIKCFFAFHHPEAYYKEDDSIDGSDRCGISHKHQRGVGQF